MKVSPANPSPSAALSTGVPSAPHRWSDVAWVALVSVVMFFLFLGCRPLSNPDEGRYSEIPREMVATHDYVTPRLDGVKYFEKPPLLYWISATVFRAVGFNEWTTRFGAAFFATLGTILVFLAARANFDRETGFWSAAILGTCLLYYGLSRVALLDLPIAVLMAGVLFAFQIAIETRPENSELGARAPRPPNRSFANKRRWLFWSMYAAMGLAVLTKGLIGFLLPGLIMAVWIALLNRWKNLRPFYPFSGSLILLAIAVPWHVLVARANADFLYFYFVHEHFLRFTTNLHDRYQPWWYFIPVMILGLFPWTIFLGQAAFAHLRGGWASRKRDAISWFLVLWVVLVMAFFSKSQSKLIPYIAPVFPALAVLIASYLTRTLRTEARARGIRVGLWIFAGLAAALGLALLFAKLPIKATDLAATLHPWRVLLGLSFLAGAIAVGTLTRAGRLRGALVALVIAISPLYFSVNFIAGIVDTRSTKSLALILKPRLRPGDAVYCLSNYSQDFPVYLDRLVDAVDFEGELDFGIHSEPEKSASRFINHDAFLARWTRPETAYALVLRRDLNRYFTSPLAPSAIVAQNTRFLLLTNQHP
jgi:4-amino-4-deoxy-L-arabinose transferase-like glycosyltransferase